MLLSVAYVDVGSLSLHSSQNSPKSRALLTLLFLVEPFLHITLLEPVDFLSCQFPKYTVIDSAYSKICSTCR